MKIILASGSPRRRELMKLTGFPYAVVKSTFEEKTEALTPDEVVQSLSEGKALNVLNRYPEWCRILEQPEAFVNGMDEPDESGSEDYVILGADSVVAAEGRILGKPRDEEDAERMLSSLSGKTHSVFTGVTLLQCRENEILKSQTFCEETKVHFRDLSTEEIREYIRTGEPMDKAGSYGIQGRGGLFVTGISGDYNNVVGLPVTEVYLRLKRMG